MAFVDWLGTKCPQVVTGYYAGSCLLIRKSNHSHTCTCTLGSVSCLMIHWNVNCKEQGSNHQPSNHWMSTLPPEPQLPLFEITPLFLNRWWWQSTLCYCYYKNSQRGWSNLRSCNCKWIELEEHYLPIIGRVYFLLPLLQAHMSHSLNVLLCFTMILTSHLMTAYPTKGRIRAGVYPSCHWAGGRVHPDRSTVHDRVNH